MGRMTLNEFPLIGYYATVIGDGYGLHVSFLIGQSVFSATLDDNPAK